MLPACSRPSRAWLQADAPLELKTNHNTTWNMEKDSDEEPVESGPNTRQNTTWNRVENVFW